MKFFRGTLRILPTILTAFLLALVVWVAAVTSTDPNEEITYTNPVPIHILGQDPDLVITSETPEEVTVTIKAPRSIHTQLSSNPNLIQATVNLSGMAAGQHTLSPEVTVALRPAKVVRISPAVLEYTLEKLTTRAIDVTLRLSGSLPISYEAGEAVLGSPSVTLTGPESLVNAVTQVVANIDLTNVTTSISRTVELRAIDSRGVIVSGVNLSPSQMPVEIPIKQMGGYRNVFVKIVTSGTIARGYYLTGLAANPPNITIYASDPEVAKNMPAFIETAPVSLNGAQISFETPAQLNLPDGITVVGDQNVVVQVSITAIESSIQLAAIPVEIINLPAGFKAEISPAVIDVYISGPLVAIEKMTAADVKATLDLSQKSVGTYQLIPVITLTNPILRIDSILPGTIEVVISR